MTSPKDPWEAVRAALEHERIANSKLLLDSVAQINLAPAFRPDTEVQSLSENAMQWFRDRLDEHVYALEQSAGHSLDLSLSVSVTRDVWVAFDGWKSAGKRAAQELPDLEEDAWRLALEIPAAMVGREGGLRSPTLASLAAKTGMDFFLRGKMGTFVKKTSADGNVRAVRNPLAPTLLMHWCWLSAFGREERHPSPWEPILALWQRGVWPYFQRGGVLGIYVPLLDRNGVKVAPERTKEQGIPMESGRSFDVREELGEGYPPGKFADLPFLRRGPLPPPELPSEESIAEELFFF